MFKLRQSKVPGKLEELATIIDEQQLSDSAAVPLDAVANRESTLIDEVNTALNGIKEVAQGLADIGGEKNKQFARALILHRHALKLLAQEHFKHLKK